MKREKILSYVNNKVEFYSKRMQTIRETSLELPVASFLNAYTEKWVDADFHLRYYKTLKFDIEINTSEEVDKIIQYIEHDIEKYNKEIDSTHIGFNSTNIMLNLVRIWEYNAKKELVKDLKTLLLIV